jgi:hypothetical protein
MKNVGAGIAIGAAIGVGIGGAMGNLGAGIAIGIAIGAAIVASHKGGRLVEFVCGVASDPNRNRPAHTLAIRNNCSKQEPG